jgi:hypothetical protein
VPSRVWLATFRHALYIDGAAPDSNPLSGVDFVAREMLVAEPQFDDVTFDNGLSPTAGKASTGLITVGAGSGVATGQAVKIYGHSGKKPYVWVGTVGAAGSTAGTWKFSVKVKHNKHRFADPKMEKEEKKDEKGRSLEDVSTTVTNNTNEESQPVNTPAVPLVP